MAITAVSASTVARFLCRRCDVTGAVIVVASHSVLRQIAKPIGHVVTREIPGNDIDEFPIRIHQVVEAAVIDEVIAPALRMRGDVNAIFLDDGDDLVRGAGQRDDARIERFEVFGKRLPVIALGSTVMKIGCTTAVSAPSRSSATPILLSAVGHASGQEVYPK